MEFDIPPPNGTGGWFLADPARQDLFQSASENIGTPPPIVGYKRHHPGERPYQAQRRRIEYRRQFLKLSQYIIVYFDKEIPTLRFQEYLFQA